MNTRETMRLADRQGRGRRLPDPAHHLRRRLRLGDGRLRRPGAARHDLPRTLRRDLAARPADLRRRRRRRCDPPSGARSGNAGATGRDVRGFQSVLLDLGARLGLPGMVHADGSPAYRDYADYIVRHERAPGVGLLAGWRGDDGAQRRQGRAESASSSSATSPTTASGASEIPEHARYYKMANRGYLRMGAALRLRRQRRADRAAAVFGDAAEVPPRRAGPRRVQPPPQHRERVATYFDPLPIWYEPFEHDQTSRDAFPLNAVTQRPMFMYHAWGSQNAWLRQIATRNFLYLHPDTGARHGIADEDWIEVTSHHGTHHACRRSSPPTCSPTRCGPGTRSASASGAWKLAKDAPEGSQGFLLNHLISDITPEGRLRQRRPGHRAGGVVRPARVDPQGGCAIDESAPQFAPLPSPKPTNARCATAPASAMRSTAARHAPDKARTMTDAAAAVEDEARPGDRPRHLRRLPRLRGRLQGMERRRHRRAADRRAIPTARIRPACGSTACTATRSRDDDPGDMRVRIERQHRRRSRATGDDAALPALVPALRDAGLRDRVPDRRQLQARRGRHRAGRRGQVHRLQAVLLGLPVRRARVLARSKA